MQRLFDDLVGYVRAVKIAGVDMVDAARQGFPQHHKRGQMIFRRAKYAGAGQLHRAITHAVYVAVAKLEGAPRKASRTCRAPEAT